MPSCYDGFDDVVQKAYRAKVVIVSPSLLMLAINVVQQIQKDARMREAADKIHAEVGHLMDDIKRLHERVLKLQQHFGQASEDVRQILISAEKLEKRGARIREVEFDEDAEPAGAGNVIPAPIQRKLQAGEWSRPRRSPGESAAEPGIYRICKACPGLRFASPGLRAASNASRPRRATTPHDRDA